MSCNSDLDQVRKSTLSTLVEIVEGEQAFKDRHGVDISDPDEWQQLKDIVARIERKLISKMQDAAE